MRYVMKQRLFSWGDDFYIRDAEGNNVFFVDGKAFSLGNQLAFRDLAGNELAFIREKLLSFAATYEIHRNGTLAAVVKKELFTLFKYRFTVDVPGPDDLDVEGNFTDHEYAFTRGGRRVATVSKQWFTWTDTYGVDVVDGADDVLILASTVIIDMVSHPDSRRH